jgi:hypothetical protein
MYHTWETNECMQGFCGKARWRRLFEDPDIGGRIILK